MSNSVRPHRRQPTRLPLSLGFSRQEHWSGLPFPHRSRPLYQQSHQGRRRVPFFRLLARGHAPPWFPSNQARPRAPPPPASLRRHFLSATGSGVLAGVFSQELGPQGVVRLSREERRFLGPRKPASPPGSVSRWC